MADRATPNLPSRDFDRTAAFYGRLGFDVVWRDAGWMILGRGPLEIEFFPHPRLDPGDSWFSACLRVDDLDRLWAAFAAAGLSTEVTAVPRMTSIAELSEGPRMFAVIDEDGSLLRCLQN